MKQRDDQSAVAQKKKRPAPSISLSLPDLPDPASAPAAPFLADFGASHHAPVFTDGLERRLRAWMW